MKKDKKNYFAVGIIMILIIIILIVFLTRNDEFKDNKEYKKTASTVHIIKIVDENPNVRSSPWANNHVDSGNSYGQTKEVGFTIELSTMYKTDRQLDQNGWYWGFSVEEILATPEGTWFPKGIKHDPDGIIWINSDYIQILY